MLFVLVQSIFLWEKKKFTKKKNNNNSPSSFLINKNVYIILIKQLVDTELKEINKKKVNIMIVYVRKQNVDGKNV